MGIIEGGGSLKAGAGHGHVVAAVAEYDFAVDGGAVGDIVLRGDSVPSGAHIVDALIVVETPFTSGGAATVAVKAQSAADVQAAALVSGSPWSAAAGKRASAVTATAAPITASAARTATLTVAVAALTAGKGKVVLYYVVVS